MAKRKRNNAATQESAPPAAAPAVEAPAKSTTKKQKATTPKTEAAKPAAAANSASTTPSRTETIQVVVGFYDGVLHGFTGTIGSGSNTSSKDGKKKKSKDSDDKNSQMDFADTFLLTAHTKSIRCLAVSEASKPIPGQSQKRILASGSSDSKINLYEVTAHTASRRAQSAAEGSADKALMRHLAPRPIAEDRRNRELGSLEHHASAVTSLSFPVRSKLMSASEDSTVAVTRTRDWALLSTLRAPMVKPEGRPSGDTAAFDGTPQGVNDFALHPSMKLMMTVSKGERKVRPWNLTTGKRAKALSYGADLLRQVGESRHASGEAQRLSFGNEEFAVGFDRNVVVFDMDGEPRCLVLGKANTKVHQVRYHELPAAPAAKKEGDAADKGVSLLAVSTDDGRIVIVSTADGALRPVEGADKVKEGMAPSVARPVASLGGRAEGVGSRIKDFTLVHGDDGTLYAIGGGSDGVVRVWAVGVDELRDAAAAAAEGKDKEPLKGRLVGTYKTDNRIMCMTAYLMTPNDDVDDEEDGALDEEEEEEEGSDSDDSDDE